jgi:hypothetical protein
MGIRVIQWGTGNTGHFALRYLVENPAYELAGVLCQTEEKHGRDAGELLGLPPVGVTATRDRDAGLATAADIVVYLPRTAHQDPSLPESPDHAWFREVCELLRSGKSVVSPTAATHHRHLARADAFVAGLDAAGAEGHATAALVGLDPGFFTDALPLTFASTVGRVAQLRTYEVLSYAHYPKIDTLRCLDPGAAPDGIADQVQGMIRPTRGGAPYALADAVGVALDGIEIEVKGRNGSRDLHHARRDDRRAGNGGRTELPGHRARRWRTPLRGQPRHPAA